MPNIIDYLSNPLHQCLVGILRDKTRVIATHHFQLLRDETTDWVIEMAVDDSNPLHAFIKEQGLARDMTAISSTSDLWKITQQTAEEMAK